MHHTLRRGALIGLLAALALWPAGAAFGLDKIRLGKAVPNSFAFGATEVGIEAKIFEQEGLEIEVTSFRGDAQLQQALAAGSIDVGLGSGPRSRPSAISRASASGSPRRARLRTGWCANYRANRAGAATASKSWRWARCRRGLLPSSAANSTAW